MSDTPQQPGQPEPSDVSKQALSVARTLDRLCRAPGTYTITIEIPAHRRHPWRVQLARVELLRDTKTPPPP